MTFRTRPLACAFFLLLLLPGVAAFAQTPAARPQSFDAVSIRPNKTASGSTTVSMDDDHFEMTNVTLVTMLQIAYDMKPAQILSLPPWATSEHFDVKGKVVDADIAALRKMTDDQRRAMFQVMLKERFGLECHMATKDLPVYELVVAKGGLKATALPSRAKRRRKRSGTRTNPGAAASA